MKKLKRVKIIKANRILRAKIGSGPVDKMTIELCQNIIDSNDVDFAPLAREYIDTLKQAIKNIKTGDLPKTEAIQVMAEPIMQLKANASIFHYALIGNLTNIMLSFMERVKIIDNDVIQIIDAHCKTLMVIISKEMKGDGGISGKQIEDELKNVCKRYFIKNK